MATALGVFASLLGIQAATLGIISFALNQLPIPVYPHAIMRVAVGMNGQGLYESEGEEPDIRLWNDYGDFLGRNFGDKEIIANGHYKDIVIPENGQQPKYALLTANNNAICVAYVTQTWPDGQSFAWVGNWGKTCGQKWHYSGVEIDHNFLDCTWIDGFGGDHGGVTGIQIHFNEFTEQGQSINNSTDYYCDNAPVLDFKTDKDPKEILIWDPPIKLQELDLTPDDRRRRSTDQHQHSIRNGTYHTAQSVSNGTHHKSHSSAGATAFEGRPSHRRRENGPVGAELVKSKVPHQSATYLCEHPNSLGADFVSLAEGKFCDMDTRKVWPLCEIEGESDCFDDETNAVRQLETRDVSAQVAKKNYVKFQSW